MRVLQITPLYAPSIGGIEDVVRSLAKSLVRAGFVCDVAEVNTSHRQFSSDRLDTSAVFRVPLHGHRLIGLAPALRRLVKDYDLLHVHDPQLMGLSANAAFWGRGKPMVMSTHGGFFHTNSHSLAKRLHARFSARAMLSLYAVVLASSEADYAAFKQLSPRVKLVPNGVNTDKFSAIGRTHSPDFLNWIYWGRFSRNKRIDCVIAYAAAARKRGFDIKLTICGTDFDKLLPALKELISGHHLQQHVEIVDSPSDADLLERIRDNSVFITASEYEGFGLSVIEALAAGLPVICRNISPLNGFIAADLNGTLLSFDGSARDHAVLDAFLSQPAETASMMSSRNREAARRYSWAHAQQAFEQVYRTVLAGR
jgi:alpha-1,3-mannosyltransferase